jgi:phosphatidate cytidylyltransferase
MTDTPAPAAPDPASELLTRAAVGLSAAAIACVLIWFGSWPFRIMVALGAAVMVVEWYDLHKIRRQIGIVAALVLAAALLGGIEFLYQDPGLSFGDDVPALLDTDDFLPPLVAFAVIALLGLVASVAARRHAAGWGLIYIGIPAFALMVLSWVYNGLVFWVMVVTWATDICAYFAGRGIGGPKLAPKISPNKTWAGLIGGMVGAGLAGWGIAALFDLQFPFQWIGAPMAVLAQAGDLYESWLKRRAGVKDSGTLLPGHGGLLDRADGLLVVAFATMLILIAGLWT